jgi:hypothetical protein
MFNRQYPGVSCPCVLSEGITRAGVFKTAAKYAAAESRSSGRPVALTPVLRYPMTARLRPCHLTM